MTMGNSNAGYIYKVLLIGRLTELWMKEDVSFRGLCCQVFTLTFKFEVRKYQHDM